MSPKKLMVVLVCVALSSQLVGCRTPESQEPTQQRLEHTEEVKESAQIITSQPKETKSNIENNAISSQIIEEELKDNREPTEVEKAKIFELVYDYSKIFSDLGLADVSVKLASGKENRSAEANQCCGSKELCSYARLRRISRKQ